MRGAILPLLLPLLLLQCGAAPEETANSGSSARGTHARRLLWRLHDSMLYDNNNLLVYGAERKLKRTVGAMRENSVQNGKSMGLNQAFKMQVPITKMMQQTLIMDNRIKAHDRKNYGNGIVVGAKQVYAKAQTAASMDLAKQRVIEPYRKVGPTVSAGEKPRQELYTQMTSELKRQGLRGSPMNG